MVRVAFFVVGGLVSVAYFSLLSVLTLAPYADVVHPPYAINLIVNFSAALLVGTVVGVLEVYVMKDRFRRRSLVAVVALKTTFYLGMILSSGAVFSVLFHVLLRGLSPLDPRVLSSVGLFLTGPGIWLLLLHWSVTIGLILFVLHMRDRFGPSMFLNFVLGRYHRVREEDRAFMFLDMTSSTVIAEQLGHERYYALLNDFFEDLSGPILDSRGEVYQYVGDEVVVTWRVDRALENANCVRCFFACQQAVRERSPRYREVYGIVPSFKAGIHAGRVAAGVVGVHRREIVFTGDVLNTASRIHDACSRTESSLLISYDLKTLLSPFDRQFRFQSIGTIPLKGKATETELYAVSPRAQNSAADPGIQRCGSVSGSS